MYGFVTSSRSSAWRSAGLPRRKQRFTPSTLSTSAAVRRWSGSRIFSWRLCPPAGRRVRRGDEFPVAAFAGGHGPRVGPERSAPQSRDAATARRAIDHQPVAHHRVDQHGEPANAGPVSADRPARGCVRSGRPGRVPSSAILNRSSLNLPRRSASAAMVRFSRTVRRLNSWLIWKLLVSPSWQTSVIAHAGDVVAFEHDLARGRRHLACQHLEEGRLACAIRPDDAAQFAVVDGEVDVAVGGDTAVMLGEAPRLQDRSGLAVCFALARRHCGNRSWPEAPATARLLFFLRRDASRRRICGRLGVFREPLRSP